MILIGYQHSRVKHMQSLPQNLRRKKMLRTIFLSIDNPEERLVDFKDRVVNDFWVGKIFEFLLDYNIS